jgi:3-isopropylmalate/(R)-2-methylmalate dehydratase small subunit
LPPQRLPEKLLTQETILEGETMYPVIAGRIAWVFTEENYDIDLIVGVENIKLQDIESIKKVIMKNYDPNFSQTAGRGDVIVGGENFGYGHPHYPAFRGLRALGISCVFADSFAPGFYRGESTNGFPLIECPGISSQVKRWDTIHFCWETETITINGSKKLYCSPIPVKTRDLISCGGIVEYLKQKRLNKGGL